MPFGSFEAFEEEGETFLFDETGEFVALSFCIKVGISGAIVLGNIF